MSFAGIVPGWLIGYLVREDQHVCEYRTLAVISLVGDPAGNVEPIVMLPDGQTLRASEVGERAFAAGPDDDVRKIAAAHAASRRRALKSIAA